MSKNGFVKAGLEWLNKLDAVGAHERYSRWSRRPILLSLSARRTSGR
jgi:hypothetical protein